jgi:hypothetical protein
MIVALVVALLLVAGASFWLTSRTSRRAPARDGVQRERKAAGRFRGVEIRIRAGACEAARSLEGRRFLVKQAPALPLPACTAAHCSCAFTKLSDRRTEGRRLEHGGLSTSMFVATNRRKRRDRRAKPAPERA